MKLLIVSDSHSMLQGIRDAVFLEKPDYLIHLGDHCGDAQEISREFPMLPVVAARAVLSLWLHSVLFRLFSQGEHRGKPQALQHMRL